MLTRPEDRGTKVWDTKQDAAAEITIWIMIGSAVLCPVLLGVILWRVW